MKTYEENVEYEKRILKLQYIIEKLQNIKDNITKLNQKVCLFFIDILKNLISVNH